MYYKESKKIFDVVRKSKKIFIACHEGPDTDSVVSCVLMSRVLKKMGKDVDIYSIDKIGINNELLDSGDKIIFKDPNTINLDNYDLVFALDVNEFRRLGFKLDPKFEGYVVNIDHHNYQGLGDLTIHDINAGGTCHLLYYLFKDWNVSLDYDSLNKLLIGILSDTDLFHFAIYDSPIIFDTVSKLISEGADYQKALFFVDQNYDVEVYKFIAEGIQNMKVDLKYGFAYTSLRYEDVKKYEKFGVRTRMLADGYLRKIKGTDFGVVMIEDEKGDLKVSVRSRTPGYYVLNLVKQLGGGGHITGGGAAVKGMPFKDAVEKVLKVARKYAKEQK